MFYFDILPALERLPADKTGTLFLAAMKYAQTDEEPTFDDVVLDFAWALIRQSIDRDGEKYDEKRVRGEWLTYCRKCRQNGNEPIDFETYRQHADNGTLQHVTDTLPTTSTSPSTTTTPSLPKGRVKAATPPNARAKRGFTPPTVEEVADYVRERGSRVDPQGFIDFYAAKGWLVGKTPMKDWKAACRNAEGWERWSGRPAQGQGAPRASPGGRNPQYQPEDFQPTGERITKNDLELREFLRGNGQTGGGGGGRREMA